ncbi:hypothetical protein [Hathewaya massiliensis]|uniref:hypothetical protein n=1 Tax=Hathewaya massiliensis TaxID=1964382 RepID=UPI00115B245D|nr:hypothetical protein [Hathewaya massiliensis]
MEDKILTIDLKNRKFKDSIIFDISSLKGTDSVVLDLDFQGALQGIGENIKKGYFENSLEGLKKIEPYFESNKNHDLYEDYCLFKDISEIINKVMKNLKSNIGLEEFFNLKFAYYSFKKIYSEYDISYFDDVYEKIMEHLRRCFEENKLLELMKKFKNNPDNMEDFSYVAYMLEKFNGIYLESEEEKEIFNELITWVKEARSKALQNYNNKIGVPSSIKALLPYEYRDFIEHNKFKLYIKDLKPSYEDYESLRYDLKNIYILYKINTSSDFYNYYNNISLLSLDKFNDLSDYYKEYITRKLFDKSSKYYSLKGLKSDLDAFIKKLDISTKTKSIPI